MTQDRLDASPSQATSERQVVKSAAALIIGSELLSGKVRDENLHALSQTLRALGIELRRVIICPDDSAQIASDIRALCQAFDVVFTSGGVGPTHDDLTIEGVALGLDLPVVQSPEFEQLLGSFYGETDSAHLAMARVPQGAVLLQSKDVRWPTIVAKNVWILPGVPELFRMKLRTVRDHLAGPVPFYSLELFLSVDEVTIKLRLDELVKAHPGVEIGSYPKWFDPRYKTRITFDARSEQDVRDALNDATVQLSEYLAPPE